MPFFEVFCLQSYTDAAKETGNKAYAAGEKAAETINRAAKDAYERYCIIPGYGIVT